MEVKRQKMLIRNFLESKLEGKNSGEFDIEQVNENNWEEYYILLKPKTGIFRDQYQLLHMKTTYGSNNKFSYPFNPPLIKFISNVFHTNISTNGSICLDILKEQGEWVPAYNFARVIMSIILLYQEPNTDSPYNVDASKLYSKCSIDYEEHKTKGMAYEQEELLREQCFKTYKDTADSIAKKNNINKYAKWFPQIVDESNDERNEEIKSMYNALVKNNKSVVINTDEKKNDTIKTNRFAKYQKKKKNVKSNTNVESNTNNNSDNTNLNNKEE